MIDYIVCVGSFYNVTVYCDKWGCKMYRQTERLRTQHSSTKTLKKMGCHCSKRGLLISLMFLDITTSVLALVLMLYGESLTNLFPLVITFIVPTLELPGKLMTSHKKKLLAANLLVRASLILYNCTQIYFTFSCNSCPTDVTAILVLTYFTVSQTLSFSFKLLIECLLSKTFEITNEATT